MYASIFNAVPSASEDDSENVCEHLNIVNCSLSPNILSNSPQKTPKKSCIIGISYRDSPKIHFSPSIAAATKLIRNSKTEKDARFKTFKSEEDCRQYYALNPVLAGRDVTSDGYRSPHKSLQSCDKTTFYKGIIKGVKNSMVNLANIDMMNENPGFFIDFSKDVPTILHAGMRFNAMHVCAREGNIYVAREIMRRVQSPAYLTSVYGFNKNMDSVSRHLVDKFLNMPDKINKHSPAIIAARYGHYEIVAFLTSFVQCDIDFNKTEGPDLFSLCCSKLGREDTLLRYRIYDALRHPMNVYCVTVYAERDSLSLPFIAITTRFPKTIITSDEKLVLFKVKNCNAWNVPNVEGTIRISDRAAPFNPQISSHALPDVESYNVVTMMGPYSSRHEACVAYRKLHCYIHSLEGQKCRGDPISMTDFLKRAIEKEAELNSVAVFEPSSSGVDYTGTTKAHQKLVLGVESIANSMFNLKTDNDYYTANEKPWTKDVENEFTKGVFIDRFLTAPSTPGSDDSYHSFNDK